MNSQRLAQVSLYGAFITVALNGILAKSIPLSAEQITHLRCFIAAIAMGVTLLIWHKSIGLKQRSLTGKAIFLGVLMTVHWTMFIKGMMVSTVAIGILAHYTFPVITVILEPIISRKRPATIDLILATIVLFGAAVMVPEWQWNSNNTWGVIFGLISALTFSLRNIFQRHWLQEESSTQVMFIQVCTVALLLTPVFNTTHTLALTTAEWFYIGFLGLVSTATCHTLIAFGLRFVSAKTTALLGCMQAPFAIFFAWLILNEVPNSHTLIGGCIILSAALYEAIKQQRAAG